MNSRSVLLVTSFAIAMVGLGYFSGGYLAERRQHELLEGIATEQLGYHLSALEWLESNNFEDVKRLLQANTSRQLDWIIQYGNLNTDPDYIKSRCGLIKRLKTYRDAHKLFETAEWDYLWKFPENRVAEDRRKAYLKDVAC